MKVVNPFFLIWINPRKAFQCITEKTEEENKANISLLFILISMPAGFLNAADMHILIGGNFFISLLIALLVSGLMGLVLWYHIFSRITYGLSKLFQGKATLLEIRIAMSYGSVPKILLLPLGLFMIAPALIQHDTALISFRHPIITFGLAIICLRFLSYGLAFFNKFSYLYALLVILIPVGIIQGLKMFFMFYISK